MFYWQNKESKRRRLNLLSSGRPVEREIRIISSYSLLSILVTLNYIYLVHMSGINFINFQKFQNEYAKD